MFGFESWTFYLIAVAGAAGVYCLMPGKRRSRSAWSGLGTVLGLAAAAALVAWLLSRRQVAELLPWSLPVVGPFFYLFALIAVAAAVRVITHRQPIYSVVYFVLTVLAVAGVLLLVHAEFLAVALVLVYAGAVIVVYVFVVMMARETSHRGSESSAELDERVRSPTAGMLAAFLLLAAIAGPLANRDNWPVPAKSPVAATTATQPQVTSAPDRLLPPSQTAAIGVELYGVNLVAVELAGVLLVVAIVGGIALARRRLGPADLPPPAGKEDDHAAA